MPDKARETVLINAPVQVCFDTLTDFERYPQWAGDLQRELDGAYHLRAIPGEGGDPDGTEVVYELSVDLVLPIPGFVKRRAEARILKTALTDLKTLVESR